MVKTIKQCCGCGANGHKPWVEVPYVYMCCELCHFMRDNMTLKEYRNRAKKITKFQTTPGTPPKCEHNNKVLNKRRGRMRDRDIKRGCDPDKTMRLAVFRNFLKKSKQCYYCGDCPTGIDRQSWKQCYTKAELKNMKASCYKCNRMKREKSEKTFLDHMKKTAQWAA